MRRSVMKTEVEVSVVGLMQMAVEWIEERDQRDLQ